MTPQPESPEPLKVVAWAAPDSKGNVLFGKGWMFTQVRQLQATMPLVRLSDAEAAIQAARNEAEAERVDPTRHEFTEEQCIDLFAAALYISARCDETSVLSEENAERIAKLLCDLAGVDLDAMKGDAQ